MGIQFKDQRVLLRLDLKTPIEDGLVSNDERLVRYICIVIFYKIKVNTASSLGETQNGKDRIFFKVVVKRLEQLLNRSIILISGINKLPSIASEDDYS